MFRYFCSLFLKYDCPIYPIVIFSYDSPKRPEKDCFAIEFPHYQVLNFNYKVIQLNRLDGLWQSDSFAGESLQRLA